MSDFVSSGEGHALPGSPQRAQVHRSPLQGQETQLHRRVHKGRHLEGNHQENGERAVCVCVCMTSCSVFRMHSVDPSVIEELVSSCIPSGLLFVFCRCEVFVRSHNSSALICSIFLLTGQQLSLEPAGQFCQGHSCWDGEFKDGKFNAFNCKVSFYLWSLFRSLILWYAAEKGGALLPVIFAAVSL